MTETLATALAAAQAEFPPITRSKRVKVKTKTGGEYSFTYAPLDAIIDLVRPVLTKHGLAFSQPLSATENGQPGLRTVLLHASGETLEGTIPLPLQPGMTAQEQGSAITYLRRYALTSMLGIATEDDDDGNRASGNQASPENRRSVPKRRVEGPEPHPVPKTWAKVQEAVRNCDNPDEAWGIFQAFCRAAGYHLFGEPDGKKQEPEQRKVLLQKASGAAVWLHDDEHVKYQGEFRYFGEPEQRGAWAAVLEGALLEIPDYTAPEPEPTVEEREKAERLQAEYEAAIQDIE